MAAELKQKSHKVLDMSVDGYTLMCVVHYDQMANPYHLYVKWYDGATRYVKQLARYQNLVSIVDHIRTWMYNNHIGFKDTPL